MGASRWSDEFYTSREAWRAATGASAFGYSDAMRNAPSSARRVHPKMNPFNVKVRESRDSAAHPASKAIAVLFDVTGSMGSIPVTLQKKLKSLMGLLIEKRYVAHPQLLFGGIGDAACDRAPLQIGQFESGIEMDDDLGRMFLEGGGGGQTTESYELAAYFMARHTSIDCFEKRCEKGYLFIIGDEQCYPRVSREQVEILIGDELEADIPTAAIFDELREKYEVFTIIPQGASNSGNARIRQSWQKLLGQNVLSLDDPGAACEAIALTIGLCEGKVDLAAGLDDLRAAGASDPVRVSVSAAVAPFARDGVAPGLKRRLALPSPRALMQKLLGPASAS